MFLSHEVHIIYASLSLTHTHSYLMRFLEVGGILILLEIVNLKSCEEADKAEALHLLTQISLKGRQYKEMICERYGKEREREREGGQRERGRDRREGGERETEEER